MLRFRRAPRFELLSGMSWSWVVATTLFLTCLLFAFWLNHRHRFHIELCPLQRVVQRPCPLCGGSTASFHLVRGEIREAWRSNPLVTLALPLVALWGFLRLGCGIRVESPFPPALRLALILLIVALNWAYLLSRRASRPTESPSPPSQVMAPSLPTAFWAASLSDWRH